MRSTYATDLLPHEVDDGKSAAPMPPAHAPHGFPGFWVRSAALAVDGLLMATLNLSIAFALVGRLYGRPDGNPFPLAVALILGTSLFSTIAYESWTTAHGRRSLGKRLFGFTIVGPRFEPLSLTRSLVRTLLAIVSVGSLFLVPFNSGKRALHDWLSGTHAIRVRPPHRLDVPVSLFLLLVTGALSGDLTGVIRERYVRAFWTPSFSMTPTLLVGDCWFADVHLYSKGEPQRGDAVVLLSPADGKTMLVDRIIGLPGETVQISAKRISIGGAILDEPWETLFIDPANRGAPRDDYDPVVVPPDSYFVLGDNRDRSYDSRFWGFVPRRNILAKAGFIYWSKEPDGPVRWERIGRTIR